MAKQHFLVVAYPIQSHINPALHLAKRLARFPGVAVTFSTGATAHRRMFPSPSADGEEVVDGLISYVPFSGFADGSSKPDTANTQDDNLAKLRLAAYNSFSTLLGNLAAGNRHVTFVIYTLLLPWAGDAASDHGIPSAQYWIQPASVFAIYYHYFHGHETLITTNASDPNLAVDLPGLPPLQIRNLPSFLTTCDPADPYSTIVLPIFRDTFESLDKQTKPKILVNSFEELEPNVLPAATGIESVELIAIGPILPSPAEDPKDMIKEDEKGYMEWLDSKAERSVVYVSFGSISVLKREQTEEISKGLKESGRPYLWVVRKECRWEGDGLEEGGMENGMVVEWCSQVRVLNHPSVGCFVTHCGWNSTAESLVAGVPMVGVPQWSDQKTNAWLVEREWGIGTRVEVNGDGLVEGGEVRRCLELVMGEGERGEEIRRKAEMWRDKARVAAAEGGSSDRNLHCFVEEITKLDSTEKKIDLSV